MDFDAGRISSDMSMPAMDYATRVQPPQQAPQQSENAKTKVSADPPEKKDSYRGQSIDEILKKAKSGDIDTWDRTSKSDGNTQNDDVYKIAADALAKAAKYANEKLKGTNKEFKVGIHEQTKQIMVDIYDKDTGEVIREVPSKDELDLFAKMLEMQGVIVDEKR